MITYGKQILQKYRKTEPEDELYKTIPIRYVLVELLLQQKHKLDYSKNVLVPKLGPKQLEQE